MRFGLQKLTLLDFPGKVACTVFSCGCNFRCPFCHNAGLVISKESDLPLSQEELFEFFRKRQGILDGICFTGGEPLLHNSIFDALKEAKNLGYKVKLDTNGSLPERLKKTVTDGLVDYVAMDIKNSPQKYSETCGTEVNLDNIAESVDFLKNSDCDFEFRTTVVGGLHSNEDFEEIGKWISGAKKYYLQRFVDSGDILKLNSLMSCITDDDMEGFLKIVKKFVTEAEIRNK